MERRFLRGRAAAPSAMQLGAVSGNPFGPSRSSGVGNKALTTKDSMLHEGNLNTASYWGPASVPFIIKTTHAASNDWRFRFGLWRAHRP